jgi:hypothetical protein
VSRVILILALLALPGCATQRDWIKAHPRTTTVIATSLMLGLMQLDGHNHPPSFTGPKSNVPTVDCKASPELCR